MAFTGRFSERAEAYAASRPSYPLEAIDALLEGLGDPARLTIADVGAGTGISSRLLAVRGSHVIAVEPNAKMRGQAEPDERVRWVDGTAERTTLERASIDLYAAFQTWHWVDHAAGVNEARRVLRRPGRIAIVYNERDERDPFTAAVGERVWRAYATDDTEQRRFNALDAARTIDPARMMDLRFSNVHALDRAGLHQRIDSSSYVPHEGDAAREMHAEADRLVDDFFGDGPVALHLATIVVRVDVG